MIVIDRGGGKRQGEGINFFPLENWHRNWHRTRWDGAVKRGTDAQAAIEKC